MDAHDATIASYDAGVATYLAKTPPEPSALARWLADFVDDAVSRGARVLEIGAGGGADAALLRDHGLEVLATDASTAFVEHLRAHGFPDAVPYDLTCDDPPAGPWDIVFANAVLPHLPRHQLVRVLRRLRAGVGNDAVLVASVKAGDGEGWTTAKLGAPRWYTYWRPETFHRALRDAGWVVVESRSRAGRFDDWICVVALSERSALTQAFDQRAEYVSTSEWHREHAEHLVAGTPLAPGAVVVDVGAGPGFVTRAVSDAIGPTGRVIAVDLSEAMLQILAASLPSGGTAIEVACGDGSALHLPDASVDAVLCGSGLAYMPPGLALREWHRVVRPGGLVAFGTWVTGQPPAADLFRRHARAFGIDLYDPTQRLGSAQDCRDALTGAGFVDATSEEGAVTFSGQDLDRAWPVMELMCRGELTALRSADRDRLRASFVTELELLARTDPAFTRARTLYSRARRP